MVSVQFTSVVASESLSANQISPLLFIPDNTLFDLMFSLSKATIKGFGYIVRGML